MSTVASPGSRAGRGGLSSWRANFREWRQSRPFWGCLFGLVAGVEIYLVAAAPLKVMAMQGLPGLLTLMIALVAIVCSGVTLFQPHLRMLTGLVVLILAPISILATNLGGFIIGMVLLIVGGGLILAWRPADRSAASAGGTAAEVPAATDDSDDSDAARPRRDSRQKDGDTAAGRSTAPATRVAPASQTAGEAASPSATPATPAGRPRYSWEANPDGTRPVQPARRSAVVGTMFGGQRPGSGSGARRPASKRPGQAARTRPSPPRPADRPATPGDDGPTQET
jgi:hypothetical protein